MFQEERAQKGINKVGVAGREAPSDLAIQIWREQARYGTESAGAKHFLAMFGAQTFFRSTNAIFYGSARSADAEIVKEICARVANNRRTLKILEVGAGTSWGALTHHLGSPWLLRAVSSALGSRVECLATDGERERRSQLFFRLPTGELFVHALEGVKFDPRLYSSKIVGCGARLRFLPMGKGALSVRNAFRDSKAVGHINDILSTYLGPDMINGGALFVRPQLDSEFEKLRYGLSTQAGVNYHDPKKSLGEQRFDLIVARHLYPMDRLVRTRIYRGLEQSLRPGGSVLIDFDGSGFHYLT